MDAIDIGGILIGLALVAYGVLRLLKRSFIKSRCVSQVAGTIIKMHGTDGFGDKQKWGTHTYTIKFKYLADGVEYVKNRLVTKRQYIAIGKHDNFTVFFNPLKPKLYYVNEIKFRMIFTLSLIAIGAVLFWVFI